MTPHLLRGQPKARSLSQTRPGRRPRGRLSPDPHTGGPMVDFSILSRLKKVRHAPLGREVVARMHPIARPQASTRIGRAACFATGSGPVRPLAQAHRFHDVLRSSRTRTDVASMPRDPHHPSLGASTNQKTSDPSLSAGRGDHVLRRCSLRFVRFLVSGRASLSRRRCGGEEGERTGGSSLDRVPRPCWSSRL